MAIERARANAVPKPWGMIDLRPWSDARKDGRPIGEIWYERPGAAIDSVLLLKLLFTNQPLSIQVVPLVVCCIFTLALNSPLASVAEAVIW